MAVTRPPNPRTHIPVGQLDITGRGVVRASHLQPGDRLLATRRTVVSVSGTAADPAIPARRVVRVVTRRGEGASAREFVGHWNAQTTIGIERPNPAVKR